MSPPTAPFHPFRRRIDNVRTPGDPCYPDRLASAPPSMTATSIPHHPNLFPENTNHGQHRRARTLDSPEAPPTRGRPKQPPGNVPNARWVHKLAQTTAGPRRAGRSGNRAARHKSHVDRCRARGAARTGDSNARGCILRGRGMDGATERSERGLRRDIEPGQRAGSGLAQDLDVRRLGGALKKSCGSKGRPAGTFRWLHMWGQASGIAFLGTPGFPASGRIPRTGGQTTCEGAKRSPQEKHRT